MNKLAALVLGLMLVCQVGYASPPTDFSPGKVTVDLNWKPCALEGSRAFEFSVYTGLGNNWALGYRQTGYDTSYQATDYQVKNRELNLIRKIGPNLDLYVGYNRTTGSVKTVGLSVPDNGVLQLGVIAVKPLNNRTKLFAIVGGGKNMANVEFGLSYALSSQLELTTTYRHLSVEKIGSDCVKANFRGFGLGVTYKF